MCGISGIIGSVSEEHHDVVFDLLTNLAMNTQRRGIHATGYAVANRDSEIFVIKRPIKASEFILTDDWTTFKDHVIPQFFLIHCRHATKGDPHININNHPFVSKDKTLALIHNGHIPCHDMIAKSNNVDLESECDSEVILRLIEKASSTITGITSIFDTIFLNSFSNASGACGLLEKVDNEIGVHFFREAKRPLFMTRIEQLNNIIVFGSTRDIVFDALKKVNIVINDKGFDLKPQCIYSIKIDVNGIAKITKTELELDYSCNSFYKRKEKHGQYGHQKELFNDFNDIPTTSPSEVKCPCGNSDYLWEDEKKACSSCKSFMLQVGVEAAILPSYQGLKDVWIKIHCEKCGAVWKQKSGLRTLNCLKCGATWTTVLEQKDVNAPRIWLCEFCNKQFIGLQAPIKCSNCDQKSTFKYVGRFHQLMLPNSWKFKKCHDCHTSIPREGPSRCNRCIDKRRKKD